MGNIEQLWEKLPKFVRSNKTVRAQILEDSEDMGTYGSDLSWVEKPIEEANMITSESVVMGDKKWHYPVLDLDFDAELVPSSTPGHFHLFLNKLMPHNQYMTLLDALVTAGLIQEGFRDGAVKRGATSVRLPWIKKGDKAANALDPDADKKKLDAAIEFHESILAGLKAERNNLNPWVVIGTLTESPFEEVVDEDVEW